MLRGVVWLVGRHDRHVVMTRHFRMHVVRCFLLHLDQQIARLGCGFKAKRQSRDEPKTGGQGTDHIRYLSEEVRSNKRSARTAGFLIQARDALAGFQRLADIV